MSRSPRIASRDTAAMIILSDTTLQTHPYNIKENLPQMQPPKPIPNPLTLKIDSMLLQQQNKQSQQDQLYLQSLPKQFIHFLKEKEIMVEELTVPIPRYIRVKPGLKLTEKELVEALGIRVGQIVRVDQEFYALAPTVKINNCKYYEKGLIYGMDYSSCIPARCLQAQQGDRILELCSAPGNKSMYLADSLKDVKIIGVEISANRANIMKNLVKKYRLEDKIEVRVEDAVTFDSEIRFDRVLIDAECTHEGSIKHIKKFFPSSPAPSTLKKVQIKAQKQLSAQQQKQFSQNNLNPYTTQIKKANEWSHQDFMERFLDEKKLNNLRKLQLGLLGNGFRLLKEGGVLVYSTCSFDRGQNQDVVREFLGGLGQGVGELSDCRVGLDCALDYEDADIQGCIRFRPSISRCGGMFVCRLRKLPQAQVKPPEQKQPQPQPQPQP